ncbi:hypothetical protein MOC42_21125, partial [Bacillus sonorensis]|nr:hypothetical protein [Bacillus sonorensis]
YHGIAFDTRLPIYEVSNAWLIAADVIGTYSDDGLVFYDFEEVFIKGTLNRINIKIRLKSPAKG